MMRTFSLLLMSLGLMARSGFAAEFFVDLSSELSGDLAEEGLLVTDAALVEVLDEVSGECPKCPIVFIDSQVGFTVQSVPNGDYAPNDPASKEKKGWVVPSVDFAAKLGAKWDRVEAGGIGGVGAVIFFPFSIYGGGFVGVDLGQRRNVTVQGTIYRIATESSWGNIPNTTLIGGQVGLNENSRDEVPVSISFMKDPKGNWMQFGVAVGLGRVSSGRRRR